MFRPLDALADATFDKPPDARSALAAVGLDQPVAAYQPLLREPSPTPTTPQGDTIFQWSSPANPRRGAESW